MNRNRSSLLYTIAACAAIVLTQAPPACADTLTVTNANDRGAGSLRDAIHSAHSGDTIDFSPSLSGHTITLTSGALTIKKDLGIEGPGASLLAISGNNSSRVFVVRGSASVIIAGLTITHGRVAANGFNNQMDGGAGILNDGGTLSLRNAVLSYNQTIDSDIPSWAQGGAILNAHHANLTVTDSTFVGNMAVGGNGALGGAIANINSTATIARSTFTDNQARGRDGGTLRPGHGDLGIAHGGAILSHSSSGTFVSVMTVDDSTFTSNQAVGGNGGDAGVGASFSFVGIAFGGAISNHDFSVLILRRSTLVGNQCIGGSGISGGQHGNNFLGGTFGGGLSNHGSAEVSDCTFDRNDALGGSDNTAGNPLDVLGVAWGGGIRTVGGIFGGTGTLIVSNSIFTANRAIAGRSAEGRGAEALGAGISVGTFYNPSLITSASIIASVLIGNQAVGGDGGAGSTGGEGLGGGIFIDAQSALTVLGSTITQNQATGGAPGTGSNAGLGIGGGAYFASGGVVCLDVFTTIFANLASASDDDVFGVFAICP